MLDSLLIKNFRAFRELKIDRLGRVNLFIGKNSTGKSSLLEAVQLLCNNANEADLYDLLRGRNEDWWLTPLASNQQDMPLRYMHHGYTFCQDGMEFSASSSSIGNISIYIKKQYCQVVQNPFEGVRLKPVQKSEEPTEVTAIDCLEVGDGTTTTYITCARKPTKDFQPHGFRKARIKCRLLPTSNLADYVTTELMDNIRSLGLEVGITENIKIIDRRIIDVFHLSGRYGWSLHEQKPVDGRVPFVRLQDIDQPIPLSNLGDGTTRLLHLILLMLNSEGGLLLIDEFENGIHWSVQHKVWAAVFQLAKKLNVQVFATTHSLDCVKAFHKAWAENAEEDGACYRLERPEDGDIIPFELPRELLEAALETSVEMR